MENSVKNFAADRMPEQVFVVDPAALLSEPMLGVALDGYAIHLRLGGSGSEPVDLDACRSHTTTDHGCHYHAGAPGGNSIIGCHSAQTRIALNSSQAQCDVSQRGLRARPGCGTPSI